MNENSLPTSKTDEALKEKISQLPSQALQLLKRRWKLALIVFLVIASAGGLYLRNQAQNQVELIFVRPERKTLTKTLEVSGVVDAEQKARLRFIAGGKVTYLGAQEGEWVDQYQTIAVIDQATLQKQLQQDLNDYMKERWDWEETQDDIEFRTIETSERRGVDQEQWDLENTVLDVEIRDIAIRNTALTAPFSGILTTSPATTAGIQLLSTDYFEIIDPTTLVFKASVDEADIGLVQASQSAHISLDAYPEAIIDTNVSYIAYTSSQTTSGTVFIVEFPLSNYTGSDILRLGMNGDVEIELTSREDVLSIPLIATRERADLVFVDVRTGEDTYEEREITIGLETDEYVQVIDGLSEEDEILLPE